MADRINSLNQEKIWIEASKKNIRDFEPLYNKYYDSLFRYFIRRTDNVALAQDLCATTFFKILDNIKKYEWQGKPFGAWLFRIAGNVLKKHFRDKKSVYVIEEDRIQCLDEGLDVHYLIHQERLIEVLDQLPEKDLRILELRFFESCSFREISQLMDLGESAVKMRVYRLLSNLKSILESHDKA